MSSNKTANLQLNQWQAGDAFLRTEFNEDNSKIDAGVRALDAKIDREVGAVGSANCMVKLMDITTTAAAQQVDLDISKIQWERYTEVIIHAFIRSTHENYSKVRLNNYAAQYGYSGMHGTSGNTRDFAVYFFGSAQTNPTANKYTIFCMSNNIVLNCEYTRASSRDIGYGSYSDAALRPLTSQETMNFCADPNETLKAGSKFLVYGVLR